MCDRDDAPPQTVFFQLSGNGNSPWEIGRPQSVIVRLVEQGIFSGEVLDIGCGIGDNAIHIATHAKNVHVTAIDFIPKAVEVARKKALENEANIEFEVIDMLQSLSTTNLKKHSFDVILDAAVFHLFSNEDRQRYIKNLEYLIKPGGLYIQFCLSEKETRKDLPRLVKKCDLNQLFTSTNGWRIDSTEDALYEARIDSRMGPCAQAYLSFIPRNKLFKRIFYKELTI